MWWPSGWPLMPSRLFSHLHLLVAAQAGLEFVCVFGHDGVGRNVVLDGLDFASLQRVWEQTFGAAPPSSLSRVFLRRVLLHERQCRTHGWHSAATRRILAAMVNGTPGNGAAAPARSVSAGTHLVREWNGRTYQVEVYWFSVKMTARLDVNATPGGRMSPIAPGIVPECSGASRVKRAARAGFAALDAPCALWYSMLVGERERSGAPGIRVFMRAPCSHRAHAAASEPARVCGLAPTRSGWPCHP